MKSMYVVERTVETKEWRDFFEHFNKGFDDEIKRYRAPIFAEIVNKMGEKVAKSVILHFNLVHDDEFERNEALLRFINMYYMFADTVQDSDPFGMRQYCDEHPDWDAKYLKMATFANLEWLNSATQYECWRYLTDVHFQYLDNIEKKTLTTSNLFEKIRHS